MSLISHQWDNKVVLNLESWKHDVLLCGCWWSRMRLSIQNKEYRSKHCLLSHSVTKMWCSGVETVNRDICVLPERYNLNQEREESVMTKVCSSLCRRMLWSIVSNAAERSNKVRMQTLPLSGAVRRSLTILSSAVAVLWCGLYADWMGLSRSLELRWSFSCKSTIRSMVFDKCWKLDTGR